MNVHAKGSMGSNDRDLLRAVAGGDRRALEELYLGYHRRLTRFLSRFTPRYENVEEIVNDTFMIVWQSAGDFRYASQVSSWIFGIAYRVALRCVRRQSHHSATVSLSEQQEPTSDPVLAAEITDWVAHGLSQLPIEQRLTLELAYTMGYSLEEIAAITDAPVGTVKARMFHARQKLRQCLPAMGGLSAASSARVE